MPIVSSTHAVGHAQVDGRRYVTEAHTDGDGGVHRLEYLANIGADYVAIRTTRAAQISDQLAEAEAQALADDGA